MKIEIRPGDGGDDAQLFASEFADSVEKWISKHGGHTMWVGDATRTITLDVSGDRRWL
jgi:protein subunit release factor A